MFKMENVIVYYPDNVLLLHYVSFVWCCI